MGIHGIVLTRSIVFLIVLERLELARVGLSCGSLFGFVSAVLR